MNRKRVERGIYKRRDHSGSLVYDIRYADASGIERWECGISRLPIARATRDRRKAESWQARSGMGDESKQRQAIEPLIDVYLEHLPERGGPVYCENTERNVREVFGLVAAHRFSDLTVGKLEDARRVILSTVSKRTANDKISAFIVFIRWCESRGFILRNPVPGFQHLKIKSSDIKKRRMVLTMDQCADLIETARREDRELGLGRLPQSPMLELVRWTGLRWNEAATLERRDIRPDGSIVVRAENAKTGRERWSPVPADTMGRIKRLMRAQKAIAPAASIESGRVFLTAKGAIWGPHNRRNSLRWLDRIIDKTKSVPKVAEDGSRMDWYALRHSFATQLRQAGESRDTVRAQLGHESEQVTGGYIDEELTDKRRALDSLLKTRPEKKHG